MKLRRLALLLLALTTVSAAADVSIVTGEEPPFTYYNAQGELDGYLVQLTRALQERLGNQSDIEINPWARVYYRAAHDKDILAFSVVRTDEREDDFFWITPLSRNVHGVYQLTPPEKTFSRLEELQAEALIGVERSDFREQLLIEAGLDNIVSYTHWAQAVEALVLGRVERLFFSPAGIAHFCRARQLACGAMHSVYQHQTVTSYMAMPKHGVDARVAQRWQQAARVYKNSTHYRKMAQRWETIYQNQYGMKLHMDLTEGIINLWSQASTPLDRYQPPVGDAVQ
ncbi:hypothetical protein HMF8227_02623 [Saliniradius amylolyticus]|uniref:Solute-binding protein family 3/N-terminal domain-containing protein n=1 Tax=Saliniradius amylolyticus TaxID=2183582 RepID=A0A2S2E5Y6_9ALTE|nr:transporter substrate-binding domain-containing protein [Saliniradius amylolyticus]AWL13075.1 hypothetical protein HMF8227_02623 [Saliniradius amylolyticus]